MTVSFISVCKSADQQNSRYAAIQKAVKDMPVGDLKFPDVLIRQEYSPADIKK
ncbi:Uncharacterized protein dnm_005720 [Desulfonema magnum]|uniref:Uncharacterized protein n=1 Tax=Desulfonema magnum TaxID=45655 RepID=A0A975BF49_9BACT|nr:Uncharacterized protein dnm_005720 [Desulfonema magnum]